MLYSRRLAPVKSIISVFSASAPSRRGTPIKRRTTSMAHAGSSSAPISSAAAGFDFFDVDAVLPPLQISEDQRASVLKALDVLSEKAKDKNDVQLDFFGLKNTNKKVLKEKAKVATLPSNEPKNRYTDVLPFDDNLVNVSSGYINASLVTDQSGGQTWKYIATQGPLPETFNDFWEMIDQYRTPMIVMLTPFDDGKIVGQSGNYLPPEGEAGKEFGKIVVRITASFVSPNNIAYRRLEVKNKESEKPPFEVLHVQHMGWPDHGIPSSTDGVVEILKRSYNLPPDRDGPVVVHCSAGIGRSGVFLTVHDTIKRILLNDDSAIDIMNTVNNLRGQRAGMVQNMQQFLFSYLAIIAELKELAGTTA